VQSLLRSGAAACSPGELIEPERAALQLECVPIRTQTAGHTVGDAIDAQFAVARRLQEPGVAQNAKVFGGVVRGNIDPLCDPVHAQRTAQQHPEDAQAGRFAHRPEHGHAIQVAHRSAS